MKLSLQRRIQLSFLLSLALVAGIGIISFYYIYQLNDQVQQIISRDIALSNQSEEIKAGLAKLRRAERTYLIKPNSPNFHDTLEDKIAQLRETVETGEALCVREETRERHREILRNLSIYQTVIQETTIPLNPQRLDQRLSVPTQKMLQLVTEISALRYEDLQAHRLEAERFSKQSNRNMILMVITTILAGLLLGIFAPSRVVLPFQKLIAAFREVQAANFNISVGVEGDDEISDLGREFNKLVEEIRAFDDMKIKKIAFERRKLDTLSNIINAGVVIFSVEGVILYMNRRLYEMLGLTSERVIEVNIDEAPVPQELKSLCNEAIERKERIEGRQSSLTYTSEQQGAVLQQVRVSLAPVRNHIGDIVNFVVCLAPDSESEAHS